MASQLIRQKELLPQPLQMEAPPRRSARRHRPPRQDSPFPATIPPTWARRPKRSPRRQRRGLLQIRRLRRRQRWVPQARCRSQLLASKAHEQRHRAESALQWDLRLLRAQGRHRPAAAHHGEFRQPGQRRARGRTLEPTPQEARPARGRHLAQVRGVVQLKELLPRPTTTQPHNKPQTTMTRPHNDNHNLQTTTSARRSLTARIQPY